MLAQPCCKCSRRGVALDSPSAPPPRAVIHCIGKMTGARLIRIRNKRRSRSWPFRQVIVLRANKRAFTRLGHPPSKKVRRSAQVGTDDGVLCTFADTAKGTITATFWRAATEHSRHINHRLHCVDVQQVSHMHASSAMSYKASNNAGSVRSIEQRCQANRGLHIGQRVVGVAMINAVGRRQRF